MWPRRQQKSKSYPNFTHPTPPVLMVFISPFNLKCLLHIPCSAQRYMIYGRISGFSSRRSDAAPPPALCGYAVCSLYFFDTRASVSRAIISSSSVGITTTFTGESSVEIVASTPRMPALNSLLILPP